MNSKIYLPENEWAESVKGWIITDCAILEKDKIAFVVRQDIANGEIEKLWDSEIPSRLLTIFIDDNPVKSGDIEYGGMSFPRAGVSRKPIGQRLMSSRSRTGAIGAIGSGSKGFEEITPIGKTEPSKGIATQKLKCIDGWAYAVGSFRDIYKRVEIGKWEPVMNGFPQLTSEQIRNGFFGFEDLDGPNESNMYAVGGHGDVWRYDGTRWHQCDFPSNEQLNTVTVAPTGEVYISGEGGNLWVGEKNSWKKIAKGFSSVLFNDSVWFNNQLWLCSGYQLKVWDGKELKTPQHNGELITYNGHMDAYDGLLVVASNYEVHAFDGNEWQCLVAPYE
ncbi:hypothetical protein D0C16_12715 [Cellvibrio sp. KY-GH-1]|uniref:hypothetical protein n=1 Tax=Cellvibrio sp. KY-GH-1 TaxID=2303332 RepID=UPI001245F61A|nr:hypothetical protein [Cellvibrio sp. KY-GH-1]QEY16756.1 hypothetical protein D0C16_12715 [Cellvibrio sp. KY-GH-1]